MLVSPAEPLLLRKLGTVSSLPEKHGADFLFMSPIGLIGVQRKEVKDFVSSCFDGRLAKELDQLKQVDVAALILEGELRWSGSGTLMGRWSKSYTKQLHLSLLFSAMRTGIWVVGTSNLTDTSECLLCLEQWLGKEEHKGLSRPKPPRGEWGKTANRDWCVWLLQGFEGIGKQTATNIVDYFDGLPMTWTVDVKALQQVEGVGKVRAQRLVEALDANLNP